MELKKSFEADLEHRRSTGFLLGIVLVLALLVAGLQYTISPSDDLDDEELLEDLAQDLEMMQTLPQRDLEVLPQTPQFPPKVVERVNPVEKPLPKEEPDRLVANQMGLTEGESEGAAAEEEQTKALAPVAVDEDDNPLNFRVVERLPEFPGGMVTFMKWLTQNLKYPPAAQQQKVQGRVVVQFVVNKDGSTSNARIVRPVHPLLDREALRVVRMMPKWKPGEDHGAPCRTLFAIPINFQL